jgi:hypothetical protein
MRIRSLGLLLIAGLSVVLTAETASAIPAFARKYQTSCHTCHIAYPKLNSFGNAFRLRGYRMPAETEDMIKEEPVPLGVEAYKRVWPDAIWPSDIPGTVPLSVDVRVAYLTQHDAETNETIKHDLRFPEEVELLAAGTLGETLSFFTAVGFGVETEHGETTVDVGIGHAEFRFNGPLGSGAAFNAKFGRLSPEITQAFNHGYLLTESMPAAMFGFNPIGFHGSTEVAGLGHAGGHHGGGGGGISLPASIDGIEVYGIVGHRFEYSAGISNGMGPGDTTRDANSSKDVFGRVGYKIGGLSLDGEEGLQNEKNWRENSLRVGLFGYRGDGGDILFQGTGHHASSFAEDQEFTRIGGDVNLYLRDLNVIFGFVRGRDSLAVFDIPEDEPKTSTEKTNTETSMESPQKTSTETSTAKRMSSCYGAASPMISPTRHGLPRPTTSSTRGSMGPSGTNGWIRQGQGVTNSNG